MRRVKVIVTMTGGPMACASRKDSRMAVNVSTTSRNNSSSMMAIAVR